MPSLAELTDREPQPALSEFNNSVGSRIDDILNKLTGANGQQRYQLWPEKVIRGGLTAAGDTLAGNVPQWAVDKDTGEVHTSPQMIEKAQEISALAGTGGIAGADATLGSTAFLRPALKYKDKLYKGKEGQQHLDVIPKDLYPEFEKMAMSGEDLTHYNFGFMNHKGQFLDREKALKYAIDEGLVDAHAGQYGALTSTMKINSAKDFTPAIRDPLTNKVYSDKSHIDALTKVDEAIFKRVYHDQNGQGYVDKEGNYLTRNEFDKKYGISSSMDLKKYEGLTTQLLADSSKPGTAIEAMGKAKPSPIEAYHGTTKDINTFEPSKSGEFGPGVYLADTPGMASYFGGRNGSEGLNIIKANVHIENPFTVTKQDWVAMTKNKTPKEVQEKLKADGYDGIIGIGSNGLDKQIIPFDASKIKPYYNKR